MGRDGPSLGPQSRFVDKSLFSLGSASFDKSFVSFDPSLGTPSRPGAGNLTEGLHTHQTPVRYSYTGNAG